MRLWFFQSNVNQIPLVNRWINFTLTVWVFNRVETIFSSFDCYCIVSFFCIFYNQSVLGRSTIVFVAWSSACSFFGINAGTFLILRVERYNESTFLLIVEFIKSEWIFAQECSDWWIGFQKAVLLSTLDGEISSIINWIFIFLDG